MFLMGGEKGRYIFLLLINIHITRIDTLVMTCIQKRNEGLLHGKNSYYGLVRFKFSARMKIVHVT